MDEELSHFCLIKTYDLSKLDSLANCIEMTVKIQRKYDNTERIVCIY